MTDDLDLGVVDRLLTTTRAVRRRLDLDRAVPPDVILECLRIAIQAPTGSNIQGWRWMVVTDPDKRSAVGELYGQVMQPYHERMRAMFGERQGAEKVMASSEYLAEIMGRVPVLVIPCVLGRPEDTAARLGMLLGEGFEPSLNLGASGLYGSIWPAVWSLMLALRSRGLGSTLTTMHLAFEKRIGDLLGIPETVTQVGVVPVAYYRGETFQPAKRRPVEEITYWNGWKETNPPG